jgi:two-component system, NtrC family, sensor kinase
VAGSIPPFYANVHELREVFLNLILNAVQSIGSKGTIHCEINYRLSDQIIEVSVADTGRGISSEHIDKLFNPFFTTRPDAVGLGLFVTKQIVHRYGGSIRVESRAGQGSLFIVQFPYLESTATVRAQKETSLSLFPHS